MQWSNLQHVAVLSFIQSAAACGTGLFCLLRKDSSLKSLKIIFFHNWKRCHLSLPEKTALPSSVTSSVQNQCRGTLCHFQLLRWNSVSDKWMSIEQWWNNNDRENLNYSEKTCPKPFFPPQTPHQLARLWKWDCWVTDQQLTAEAMTWPTLTYTVSITTNFVFPIPTLRYSALEKIFSFPPLQDSKMSNPEEISIITKDQILNIH